MATGVGFEPTHELPRLADFESALFSRLSNPPNVYIDYSIAYPANVPHLYTILILYMIGRFLVD